MRALAMTFRKQARNTILRCIRQLASLQRGARHARPAQLLRSRTACSGKNFATFQLIAGINTGSAGAISRTACRYVYIRHTAPPHILAYINITRAGRGKCPRAHFPQVGRAASLASFAIQQKCRVSSIWLSATPLHGAMLSRRRRDTVADESFYRRQFSPVFVCSHATASSYELSAAVIKGTPFRAPEPS